MKIDFPHIVRPIDLGDYAPEMQGQKIFVWVNPPSGDLGTMFEHYSAVTDKKTTEEEKALSKPIYIACLSDILSQGEEDTHMSIDDLDELETQSLETEPLFWMWFINRIVTEINDHRLQRKKA